MRFLFLSIGHVFAIVFTVSSVAAGETPSELAEFVLDGMLDSREKLETGLFTANEHMPEHDARVMCAFSVPEDKYSFHLEMGSPMHVAEGSTDAEIEGENLGLLDSEDFNDFIRLIRLHDRIIRTHGGTIHVDDSNLDMECIANQFRPWDPSILGMTPPGLHRQRPKWSDYVESLRRKLKEPDGLTATREGKYFNLVVRYRLGTEEKSQLVEYRYQLLASTFLPTSIEQWTEVPGTGKWMTPEVTKVKWKEIAGAYVPAWIGMESRRGPMRVDFEWQSVNENVQDSNFDFREWEVGHSTMVLDNRLGGRPVAIDRVEAETIPRVVSIASSSRSRNLRIVIGGLVSGILTLLIGSALRRK